MYERTRNAYTLDRLENSQEILLYREPKELSLTIWVIVLLFAAVICWIVFGKMEEGLLI